MGRIVSCDKLEVRRQKADPPIDTHNILQDTPHKESLQDQRRRDQRKVLYSSRRNFRKET